VAEEQGPDGSGMQAAGEGQSVAEQQAIAAALMLGDQMRRENRSQVYFYVQRIGLFVAVLGMMGMVMLFGYTQLSKGEFNPMIGMILLGLVMAGGASTSYWGYVQSRHAKEE